MSLLVIGSERLDDFYKGTKAIAPDRDVRAYPDTGNTADIKYALAWRAPFGALAQFENLELIVSVGAGVDHLFTDPDLPDVPIVRYVDPDLTARMVQYVVLQTLYHVRRMTEFQSQQRARQWTFLPEPMPGEVRVGIMGIGVLGQACAKALGALGYQLNGWSRNQKSVDGVTCFAGDAGLDPFLNQTDVLIVLLAVHSGNQRYPKSRSLCASCRPVAAIIVCPDRCSSMPGAEVCRSKPIFWRRSMQARSTPPVLTCSKPSH